jgi:hypothetical protein
MVDEINGCYNFSTWECGSLNLLALPFLGFSFLKLQHEVPSDLDMEIKWVWQPTPHMHRNSGSSVLFTYGAPRSNLFSLRT